MSNQIPNFLPNWLRYTGIYLCSHKGMNGHA
jgi:hypothetical protein